MTAVRTLLDALTDPARRALAARPALEAEVAALLSSAHRAWPGVAVPDEAFLRWMGERLRLHTQDGDDPDGPGPLGRLCAGDLYLACGCARGDAAAIAAFERTHLPALDGALRRLGAGPDVIADVKQELRRTLLLPSPQGGPPAIAGYRGRGALGAWLRVTAVRRALRTLRKRGSDRADDALIARLSAGDDPARAYLRAAGRSAAASCLRAALAALEPDDRRILREQLVEGRTVEQIAGGLGLHPVSAARRLARARAELLSQTRRAAMQQLGLGRAEVDSLLHDVRSQIDLSLERLLASDV